jgi:hypothetical protein
MSKEQASILMNKEMYDVKSEIALKTSLLMNKLSENRRYIKVEF